MSRSGMYEADLDSPAEQWAFIRYRGAVKSAIRGKRGQAFLREMLEALDALPEPRLIDGALFAEGEFNNEICDVCAMGAVGLARGLDMVDIDPENPAQVAEAFGVVEKLAAEVEWQNDDAYLPDETPEHRFIRVREWVVSQIAPTAPTGEK